MKALNIKLATFSFAALLLASCSDSNNDNGTEGSSIMNPKIVGSTVVSTTDAQTLATQVINYKKKAASTTKATRTIDDSNSSIFEGVIEMPTEPTVPADAVDLATLTDKSNEMHSGGVYVLKSGNMSTDGMNVAGTTIYVCSGATLTWNAYENNIPTVIVLSGGKIIDTYGNVGKCCNADVYGNIETKQDRIEINHTFRTSQSLNAEDKNVSIAGKAYIGGNVTAKNFYPVN